MNWSLEMKLDPSVLQHLNIPKALHGMNPRTIKGQYWWDKTRKAVYAEQEYKCLACGVHKEDALFHKHIEAHECYDIDYTTGCVKIEKIVGLCHCCHQFIHSGLTKVLLSKGQISDKRALTIMRHGFKILKNAGLEPWYGSCINYIDMLDYLGCNYDSKLLDRTKQLMYNQQPKYMADWSEWYLLLEGEKYYGFKNKEEWEQQYK